MNFIFSVTSHPRWMLGLFEYQLVSICCIFLFDVQLRQNPLKDWVECREHLGRHFTEEICFAENQKGSAQIHIRIFILACSQQLYTQ